MEAVLGGSVVERLISSVNHSSSKLWKGALHCPVYVTPDAIPDCKWVKIFHGLKHYMFKLFCKAELSNGGQMT